jgi:general secretion pathway protein G
MMIPDRLTKNPFRERARAKKRIQFEADMERGTVRVPDGRFGRQPSFLVLGLAMLILAGGLLLSRHMPAISSFGSIASNGGAAILEERASRNVDALRIALERFRRDCGRYPTAAEGLQALAEDSGLQAWKPYVRFIVPDPWERPYFYSFTNGLMTVLCCGPDGKPGTADDVRPREPTADSINRDEPGAPPAESPGGDSAATVPVGIAN